jgi:PadR family transcriptional regulator, regulatory protein PadR
MGSSPHAPRHDTLQLPGQDVVESVSDEINREFRLAFWKIHILHHASRRPVYGLWMLEELAEHGHRLSPGTLYPILARMEKNGWLRSDGDGTGKARRNYRITPEGRKVLATLRADLRELYSEVVARRAPGTSGS